MLGERLTFSLAVVAASCALSCGGDDDPGKASGPPTTSSETFDTAHQGQYHRGPVDFAETEWHNACAPVGGYRNELRETVGLRGEYLAGVSNQYAQGGGVCDACILIETARGKSIVARVVTYGVQQEAGDIDVSPSVYDAIHEGEYPRSMSWSFARCPDVGGLKYEFHEDAHEYWTSLWVRDPRVPLMKAEVKRAAEKSFTELQRSGDGTLVDTSGFGKGSFTLRLTALDGQVLTDELPGFKGGQLVRSSKQFE